MRVRTSKTELIKNVEFKTFNNKVEYISFVKITELENGEHYRTYFCKQDNREYATKSYNSYKTEASLKSAIAYAQKKAVENNAYYN